MAHVLYYSPSGNPCLDCCSTTAVFRRAKSVFSTCPPRLLLFGCVPYTHERNWRTKKRHVAPVAHVQEHSCNGRDVLAVYGDPIIWSTICLQTCVGSPWHDITYVLTRAVSDDITLPLAPPVGPAGHLIHKLCSAGIWLIRTWVQKFKVRENKHSWHLNWRQIYVIEAHLADNDVFLWIVLLSK